MTYPRRVVPGTTYLLTRRCMHRRFTLVPRGVVPKLFGYCVALAAERHGVEVHADTCMSNHWHAAVTDTDGNIPEFCRDVHSLSARALNAHLGRWEALWSSQRLSLVELIDAPDVWDKLVYTLGATAPSPKAALASGGAVGSSGPAPAAPRSRWPPGCSTSARSRARRSRRLTAGRSHRAAHTWPGHRCRHRRRRPPPGLLLHHRVRSAPPLGFSRCPSTTPTPGEHRPVTCSSS
jgi:REP element-mobilizing transposase RayT